MAEAVKEPRITWGSRDFASNMAVAAAREGRPRLAQFLNQLAELARVKGLWTEDTLKHLYGLAGCMLALDRPADVIGAADMLASKQAGRLQWGETYQPNAQALRAHASTLLGNKKVAHEAQRRIGRPMPGSAKEITDRWNKTLRFYHADVKGAKELHNGIAQILETGHIQANIVRSLLTAPPEFKDKVGKIYAETKTALSSLLAQEAVSSSKLTPVKPEPEHGVPALPKAFQPKASDPKLVRHFKERIWAHPSFKSELMLDRIIDLAWMLYALDRAEESLEVIEAVLDYHRDDENFVLNTAEGMEAVKLAALLRGRLGGGPRLEEHRAILDKLEEINQRAFERNRRVARTAPEPREAARRVLEELVPRGLAEARTEPRRVRAFALLRTSLDNVAMSLVRESYAGLSAEQVRRYLTDGLAQFRDRIQKGQ